MSDFDPSALHRPTTAAHPTRLARSALAATPGRLAATPGRLAAVALAACLLAAGCVGTGSPTPGATAHGGEPTVSPTSSAVGASGGATPPSQTSTDWGRIWDGLPAAFPVEPGAEPVPDPSGPASATLAISTTVSAARAWWQDALEAAGYSTVGASGPLEDGSVVIDSTGTAGCRVQVRLTPAGPGTTATILFGAGCPFD